MKIIDGIYRPDAGTMHLFGHISSVQSPKEAQHKGIAMIHQELNNVLEMTVAENIFLGREPVRWGLLDRRRMNQDARKALAPIKLDIDPDTKMKCLSCAQMQMVEIAKAISYKARIIIMDEPTSAISDKEVDALFAIIAMLRTQGVGIVYISHKMNEVFRIADRITVLRDGKTVATCPASELDSDKLITLMVGRALTNVYPPDIPHERREVVLEVKALSCAGKFENISFSLHAGEILGVAGLMGAGRSELLETIFGLREASGGCVKVLGKALKIKCPVDAIAQSIAFVTEDRKHTGLNLKTSVKRDISIVTLGDYCRAGQFIDNRRENEAVDRGIQMLNVKTPSRNQQVVNLSGGNQQKVILARWLLASPKIILLDEPTRGIDVGAKYEIYLITKKLAAAGKAVLMVSSEMPELIGVCDRVIVLSEGRLTGELDKAHMTQEAMMGLAAGLRG
ncbi:MAG: sugar ABC transporter ATP-binding protein, partial [Clostridia bacterium]